MSSLCTRCLAQIYLDRIQESPTLELANDCLRFVTGYFEIISASSTHIYHSALVFAPQKSIVRRLYESHARPFTRIVQGVPMSWDQNTTAIMYPSVIELAVWSPCSKFIAIACHDTTMADVLDSATLQRLQTLESPQDISTKCMALVFSPDSRILSCVGHWDGDPFVVSWDLQTGGVASVVRWEGLTQRVVQKPSVTYSADGRMVGVFYWYRDDANITILISDVTSGVRVDSHSINGRVPLSKDIWTYGESLQFATADWTAITIWEVGFTSGAIPTEVETLPALNQFSTEPWRKILFFPAPCRLAFISGNDVTVWDIRNSEYLLCGPNTGFYPEMSFSSDGRFFASSIDGSGVYLWKESPTGYILHGKLATGADPPRPFLSPNGESIVAFGSRTIRLWRTKSFIAPPSSTLTRASQGTENFVLDFSPDEILAVIARQGDNTVTILSLKSGVPQLSIGASVGVCGLGVIGNTVVAIGDQKAITWNLPAGDFVPDARVGLKDSSRMINYRRCDLQFGNVLGASISSDSRHIALTIQFLTKSLHIYSISTGKGLGWWHTRGHAPRFSPDGCDIWCADDKGEADVWRVVGGQKALERLEQIVDIEHPPEGYPWGSSRGYRVTDDWWILGPDGKRLLMLPPPWQSDAVRRVWKGWFLLLLHGGLPEPVILEFSS